VANYRTLKLHANRNNEKAKGKTRKDVFLRESLEAVLGLRRLMHIMPTPMRKASMEVIYDRSFGR
jgi:hypothetical protein